MYVNEKEECEEERVREVREKGKRMEEGAWGREIEMLYCAAFLYGHAGISVKKTTQTSLNMQ